MSEARAILPGTPPASGAAPGAGYALAWSFNPWRDRPFAATAAALVTLGLCLAIWGYFLVQSGYFLMATAGPSAGAAVDPFDRARARLLRLLEDDRV